MNEQMQKIMRAAHAWGTERMLGDVEAADQARTELELALETFYQQALTQGAQQPAVTAQPAQGYESAVRYQYRVYSRDDGAPGWGPWQDCDRLQYERMADRIAGGFKSRQVRQLVEGASPAMGAQPMRGAVGQH